MTELIAELTDALRNRRMDWSAIDDDGDGKHPVGRGATEQEAIEDLLEKLEDETCG